ncbi:phosphate ABC transporter permease PstA [Microaerobacter geothermalis]|uniref:phosphate ABC transporter permease PstA n=1 Tax=Microaerobacter geothermalis TaxID=674972 RepID=UPI001F1BB6F4|nr:phosphate ABC transporter permease PstA [Microaerobacter geothermalis]MCF6093714.1 phosphate ABC transporter permease PstA [Microaerobacter geothermalis]
MDVKLEQLIKKRKRINQINHWLFFAGTSVGIITLAILIYSILSKGLGWFDWQFLTSFPSRFAEKAGIKSALWGSIWLIALTAPISFILGVGTAIYLEEYAKKNWFSKLIQININNLAGVPSIVFGILGLTLFVRGIGFGRSLIAGALTMSLLILPIIVVSAQEAIRAIPETIRNASYALGSTRWQTIRNIVLPAAFPSILTGTILALSRAIGETAPLIMIGALTFVAFTPKSIFDSFTVLPIQIFNWTSRPQEEFQYVAAAGIMVLLIVLLTMNSIAIYLRNKFQRRF